MITNTKALCGGVVLLLMPTHCDGHQQFAATGLYSCLPDSPATQLCMLLPLQVPKVVKKAGWALRSVLKGT
jgi:hypothetical protein